MVPGILFGVSNWRCAGVLAERRSSGRAQEFWQSAGLLAERRSIGSAQDYWHSTQRGGPGGSPRMLETVDDFFCGFWLFLWCFLRPNCCALFCYSWVAARCAAVWNFANLSSNSFSASKFTSQATVHFFSWRSAGVVKKRKTDTFARAWTKPGPNPATSSTCHPA